MKKNNFGFTILAGLWVAITGICPPVTAMANPMDDPPPSWIFKKNSRPVKVVNLAGSIGAWPKGSYSKILEGMCSKIEVKNLSKTGYGAYYLRKRFRQQVLGNPGLKLDDKKNEYWLIFQGGLNSVGRPQRTNSEISSLFRSAHKHGMKVLGLTLTPWGDDSDQKRWKGVNGLKSFRSTRKIVGFVLGRLTPLQSLGKEVSRRNKPEAPWSKEEVADFAVDLYNSPLRDANAPPRSVKKMRAALENNLKWQKAHSNLNELERSLVLADDAQEAAQIPRWYLKKELRSFDHIHPNSKGHRIIAETICPELPGNWGCSCASKVEMAMPSKKPKIAETGQPDTSS